MCNVVILFLLQNLDTISPMPRDQHYSPRNRLATKTNILKKEVGCVGIKKIFRLCISSQKNHASYSHVVQTTII